MMNDDAVLFMMDNEIVKSRRAQKDIRLFTFHSHKKNRNCQNRVIKAFGCTNPLSNLFVIRKERKIQK